MGDFMSDFSQFKMRSMLLGTLSRRDYYLKHDEVHQLFNLNAHQARYWLNELGGLASVW